MIFRASTAWQLVGFFVASVTSAALVVLSLGGMSVDELGGFVVFVAFVVAGLWGFGQQVRLSSETIEKRSWWKRESLNWTDVTEFLFLGNNRWMVVGSVGVVPPQKQVRIVLPRQYVDFDRLLQEIGSHMEAANPGSTPDPSESPNSTGSGNDPDDSWIH